MPAYPNKSAASNAERMTAAAERCSSAGARSISLRSSGVTRTSIASVRPMCGIKATDRYVPQRTARRRLTPARHSA